MRQVSCMVALNFKEGRKLSQKGETGWRLVCHACGWKGPKNGAGVHTCSDPKKTSLSLRIHDLSKPCDFCFENDAKGTLP